MGTVVLPIRALAALACRVAQTKSGPSVSYVERLATHYTMSSERSSLSLSIETASSAVVVFSLR